MQTDTGLQTPIASPTPGPPPRKKALWHHLYFWVLVGIAAGIVIGLVAPQVGAQMKWLADLFIRLVKGVIAPTIFATVAVGIAGLGNLARAGGLALKTVIYFNITTVFALGIGLVVINLLGPRGPGLDIATFDASAAQGTLASAGAAAGEGITGFILHLVPGSFFGAFVDGQLIQVLVMAILVACAISMLGERQAGRGGARHHRPGDVRRHQDRHVVRAAGRDGRHGLHHR